ncbi:MAG TPA: dockerin type I domain-containing protein, partial [candidate division Zixibacteria bacterium]|nr:dockerin type I domain-containing protein [candidate division Zixibacteria bacterium]
VFTIFTMNWQKSTIFSVIMSFTILGLANSQCPPIFEFDGEGPLDLFGATVSSAGDVNADGYIDVIIGAPLNDFVGDDAGRTYVYSGLDGQLIYLFNGEAAGNQFGNSVSSTGDVNNDGHSDIIIGANWFHGTSYHNGKAYVYSGLTAEIIYTFVGEGFNDELGASVSEAGDCNNDGYGDFIVGASGNDDAGIDAGRVYIYSGQTGDTMFVFSGPEIGGGFGEAVSSAGDVDNDDYDDIIIGAWRNSAGGSQAGRAFVYSGRTGNLLYTFTGETAGDNFGYSVASAGDANKDGYSDLIVGAIGNDAGGPLAGRAYVYSGQTGTIMYTFTGMAEEDLFGFSVSTAGDINGDSFDDLVVGSQLNDAGGNNSGSAHIYSGKTGNLVNFLAGEGYDDRFGVSVSNGGDLNIDGFDDVLIGAPLNLAGGTYGGRVYVFSGKPSCCGDVNGDGVVNLEDVLLLEAYYFDCGGEFAFWGSDLNCDGSVNLADLTVLARHVNGVGPPPCCLDFLK